MMAVFHFFAMAAQLFLTLAATLPRTPLIGASEGACGDTITTKAKALVQVRRLAARQAIHYVNATKHGDDVHSERAQHVPAWPSKKTVSKAGSQLVTAMELEKETPTQEQEINEDDDDFFISLLTRIRDANSDSWGQLTAPRPRNVDFMHLLNAFVPAAQRDSYAVNIGGNDGMTHDPVYPLFQQAKYGGIVVEPGESYRESLADNLRVANHSEMVFAVMEAATPLTMPNMLKRFSAPMEFDALKIDIDSYDLPLLRSILDAGYGPKVIMVEVNLDVPPPFKFYVDYSSGFIFGDPQIFQFGVYGASAVALYQELAVERMYSFVAFDFNDAEHNMWFVRKDFMSEEAGMSWKGMFRSFWADRGNAGCFHMNSPVCPIKQFSPFAIEHGALADASLAEQSWFLASGQHQPPTDLSAVVLRPWAEELGKHCAGECRLIVGIAKIQ